MWAVEHREFDDLGDQESYRHRNVLRRVDRFELEIDPQSASDLRCPGSELGGELREKRSKRDTSTLLHLSEMVPVDYRKCAHASADSGVGRARLDGLGAPAMDVQQR